MDPWLVDMITQSRRAWEAGKPAEPAPPPVPKPADCADWAHSGNGINIYLDGRVTCVACDRNVLGCGRFVINRAQAEHLQIVAKIRNAAIDEVLAEIKGLRWCLATDPNGKVNFLVRQIERLRS